MLNQKNVSHSKCLSYAKNKRNRNRHGDGKEVSPKIAIGLVEIFAGALACIIPFPAIQAVGVGAIIDGVHRIGNGAEDLDEKNREGGWPAEVPRPIERSRIDIED